MIPTLNRPEPRNRAASAPGRRHHLDRRAADLAAEGAAAGEADELLDTTEVSEWLGISVEWVEIGRSRGYGPAFVRLSPRRVRYRRSDVLAWLAERTHASAREYDTGTAGRRPGSRLVAGKVLPAGGARCGGIVETKQAPATQPGPADRIHRRQTTARWQRATPF